MHRIVHNVSANFIYSIITEVECVIRALRNVYNVQIRLFVKDATFYSTYLCWKILVKLIALLYVKIAFMFKTIILPHSLMNI